MKALLVLILSVGALASRIPYDSKIIGGSTADDGQFPYQISLRSSGSHICGGSIINENTVLTAAHCVYYESANFLTVVTGTNLVNGVGTQYQVRSFTPHSNFDKYVLIDDIALVHLFSNIEYNNNVQPINLSVNFVEADVECVLSGWGMTIYPGDPAQNLQFIDLFTVSNDMCSQMHETMMANSQICTYTKVGEGSCHLDSGGPLVSGQEQIGIVSWGVSCAVGYPDVFTRVSAYIDWINDNLNN